MATTAKSMMRNIEQNQPTDSEAERMRDVYADVLKRFNNGDGYGGIAADLNWPIGTVRSRLHRARKQLQRIRTDDAINAALAEEAE